MPAQRSPQSVLRTEKVTAVSMMLTGVTLMLTGVTLMLTADRKTDPLQGVNHPCLAGPEGP